MADPRKNPLIGAFRSPSPGDPPPDKPSEDKKPAELPKEVKAPTAPAKPGEDKKPTEPPKDGKEQKPAEGEKKAPEGKAPATSAKADESKKPMGEKQEEKKPQMKEGEISAFSQIPIEDIEPNGLFPLDEKDPSFKLLIDDISKRGLLEPISLNKKADGKYEVVNGNRRLAAMKKLGAKTINAFVANLPDKLKGTAQMRSNMKTLDDDTSDTTDKPDKDKETAKPPKDGKEQKAAEGEKKAPEDKAPAEEVDKDGIPKDFSMQIVGDDKLGKVTKMAIDLIDDFEGHPFPVRDDEDMAALVQSIKQVGVLEPAVLIRHPKKFGRFEMVAGHRRMHAAKLAGLTYIPVIVRDMDHDEATIYMVDSNLKREIPLTPMEKARAYTMRSDALKRKTGRRSKEEQKILEATGQKPKTADEQLAEQTGESVATVQRLKTLTKLTPSLQEMVDKKQLPVNTAADIAQLKPTEQDKLADAIEKEGGTVPSGTKAKELKEASKAGTLTPEKIEAAVAPTKREVDPPLKVTLNDEELRPYFPKGATIPDVKRVIFEALDLRKKAIERQKAKTTTGKDAPKKSPAPAR